MFVKSATMHTPQGRAIQDSNERWGESPFDPSFISNNGQPVNNYIGIPVCKKKYTPFQVRSAITVPVSSKTSSGTPKSMDIDFAVERMYGCACHSDLRKKVIEKHGERTGWEPFGQWSLAKAKSSATKIIRLETKKSLAGSKRKIDFEDAFKHKKKKRVRHKMIAICENGSCIVKETDEYDNINTELQNVNKVADTSTLRRMRLNLIPEVRIPVETEQICEEQF
mmetsp:Transcript_21553/g.31564  ORF Transcript_21553/g.31564 Transcript_21553/m.31564 type:complete len:224 (+) Transcript_21553:295-966(+)